MFSERWLKHTKDIYLFNSCKMTRLFSNYSNFQEVHAISKKWVTLSDLIDKIRCKEAKIVFVRNLYRKVDRLSGVYNRKK